MASIVWINERTDLREIGRMLGCSVLRQKTWNQLSAKVDIQFARKWLKERHFGGVQSVDPTASGQRLTALTNMMTTTKTTTGASKRQDKQTLEKIWFQTEVFGQQRCTTLMRQLDSGELLGNLVQRLQRMLANEVKRRNRKKILQKADMHATLVMIDPAPHW